MPKQTEDKCKDCWEKECFPNISSSRRRSILGFILILFFAADFAGIAFFLQPTPIAATCLYLGSVALTGGAICWFIKEGIGRSKYYFVQGDREHLHRKKPQIIDRNGSIIGDGVIHPRLFKGYVLQLYHGGWFRQRRVLVASESDREFSLLASWRINCWKGNHDLYLTDQRGEVRGPFSPKHALEIVANHYSFKCLDRISDQRLAALQIALSFLWKMHEFLGEGRKGTGWGDSKYARLMRDAIGMVRESIRNQLLKTEGGSAVEDLQATWSRMTAEEIIRHLTQSTHAA